MKCYAQFYYGSGGGCGVPYPDSYESFSSLKEVKDALWRRYNRHSRLPCANQDGDAEALVWFGTPDPDNPYPCDASNYYPDRRVFFGPRGGVRVERC